MVRQGVLVLVAVATFSLAGAQPAVAQKDAHGEHAKCARACADCAVACSDCFLHCAKLAIDGKKGHAEVAALCLDCAEICGSASKIVGRQGPGSVLVCEGCAKICDRCETACKKFPDDAHMKACAKSCQDCARACREMIAHAGHLKKKT